MVPIGGDEGDAYLHHYECMLGSGAEESTAGEWSWLPESGGIGRARWASFPPWWSFSGKDWDSR